MELSKTINLREYLPKGDLGEVAGIDVVFDPTRSSLIDKRLEANRATIYRPYHNEDGKLVHRWVFVPARGHVDSILLHVEYTGEGVRVSWADTLSVEQTEMVVVLQSPEETASRIRKWFDTQKELIKRRNHGTEEYNARLFFLHLDQVSLKELIDAESRANGGNGEARQAGIELINQICDVQEALDYRAFYRVTSNRKEFDRVTNNLNKDSVKAISQLMMPLFQRFFSDVDPRVVLDGFSSFAAGDYELTNRSPHSNGRPCSSLFFQFGDFALLAAQAEHREQSVWKSVLGPLVMSQRVYMTAYGPPPRPYREYQNAERREVKNRSSLVDGWDRQLDPSSWDDQVQENLECACDGKYL